MTARVPFKDHVGDASVRALAAAIAAVDARFDAPGFVAHALAGLEPLTLKQRVSHVRAALATALDVPFPEAAAILTRAVPAAGLDMWAAWPATEYVEVHGLEDAATALDALGVLTASASAEMAIRPYVTRHPGPTVHALREWSRSPDVHRRRLVSEGTRPRLPWASRVAALLDPGFTLPLVEPLRDDPEAYVRRSVANHLNDVAKDHPDIAVATARRWLGEGGRHTASVVRHALRGLVRTGYPDALALVGVAPAGAVVATDLAVATPVVPVGGSLSFSFRMRCLTRHDVTVLVQYAIHHLRADGRHGRKVYFLSQRTLRAGADVPVAREHPFVPVTVRRLHPGTHRVEVIVNGESCGLAEFELVAG